MIYDDICNSNSSITLALLETVNVAQSYTHKSRERLQYQALARVQYRIVGCNVPFDIL